MQTKRTSLLGLPTPLLAAIFLGGSLAIVGCNDEDATNDGGSGSGGSPTQEPAGGSPAQGGETNQGGTPASQGTIVDVATKAGNFTTLVAALSATGLDETLSGEGPFTVFAPTDDAFAKLPEGVVESLLGDTETLSKILTYHVVAGSVAASDVVGLSKATTVEGEDIAITLENDNAAVILNGTVQVTVTDIAADNGVIHVLDAVLLPPTVPFPGTIVDQLSAYPLFSTLVGAVSTAGLVETLNGEGPFTVLAPNNFAFERLGLDLSTLGEALSGVLLYHVIPGSVPAATVVTLPEATTANGAKVTISVADGVVTLNGSTENPANVVQTDLASTNGLVHVIDGVLVPPM